jgi:hypothetical protein
MIIPAAVPSIMAIVVAIQTPAPRPGGAGAPVAPPQSTPAQSGGGPSQASEVDLDCLKAAIKDVEDAVLHAVKIRDDDQRKADQARYDKAKADWDAKRAQRNDDVGDDAERDYHSSKRREGNKPPPAPKRSDFNSPTWTQLMKAEIKEERRLDPRAGSKERVLIAASSPINAKPAHDFVKKWRDKVTDKRIGGLLKDIEKAYAARVADKAASSAAP